MRSPLFKHHRNTSALRVGKRNTGPGNTGVHKTAREPGYDVGEAAQISAVLSLRAFVITETELKLIATAASIGLNRMPNAG